MKNLTLNKLALAVALTGGALVGCDSDYNTQAVKTEDANKAQGDFVVAKMDGSSANATLELAQYEADSDMAEGEADDRFEPQEDLPGSVENRRPGQNIELTGEESGVSGYDYRSTTDQIVQFEFDSSELTSEAKENLREFVGSLNQDNLAAVEVAIKGYTDTTGPEEYNQDLAERRAEAVKNFLEEEGLASYNLQIEAVGEPDGESLANTAQENRRVIVSVEPPYQEDEVS